MEKYYSAILSQYHAIDSGIENCSINEALLRNRHWIALKSANSLTCQGVGVGEGGSEGSRQMIIKGDFEKMGLVKLILVDVISHMFVTLENKTLEISSRLA